MTTNDRAVPAGAGEGEQRVAALEREIAQLREAQERGLAVERQRVESEKLEAVATLVSGLAHDFNNLLSVIGGNAELAQMQQDVPAAVRSSLDQIAAASRRASVLVQQLQTFSRRRSPRLVPLSLAAVVEDAVASVRAELPPATMLELVARAGLPDVPGDAAQLQQLVRQLLANALEAVDGGGRVEVVLEEAGPAGDRDTLRLVVRDDGRGMNETIRRRIFEPFFTTKPRGRGTGLGLAVVHGIVRQMGGSISVESAPGAGTTVEVLLPAASPPAAAAPQAPVEQPGVGRRVLYIDDEEALVFLAQRLLAMRGYEVRAFSDVSAAIAALAADPAAIDVVVTDQNMPGTSGIDVARAVREIRADLPVILASGYVDDVLSLRAEQAGVSRLVEKPDTMEGLCAVIEEELRRRAG